FNHPLKYLKPEFKRISSFLYKNVNGVIASDFDYVLPLQGNSKFLGLIPNPINIDKLNRKAEFVIEEKIIIFLGINQNAYYKKGIPYFEKALKIIQEKYPDKDRKSTRLNSSHVKISYAVFCLKKKIRV